MATGVRRVGLSSDRFRRESHSSRKGAGLRDGFIVRGPGNPGDRSDVRRGGPEMSEPTYGEKSEQEPEYGETGGSAESRDEAVDTGTENPDLHGQAAEVQESASGPGPAETPAG